jgi:hypothetical protein
MWSHGYAFLSAAALVVACQGCQRTERTPEPAPPLAAPVAQQPKPGDRVDVHGITVKFLDGGTIELSGRDRWGNALDTTFETIEYFRNALPVLERSVTAEQAAGLRALIPSAR